jgi:hypothetical protein
MSFLVSPLVEEIAFRGDRPQILEPHVSGTVAVLLSSLTFYAGACQPRLVLDRAERALSEGNWIDVVAGPHFWRAQVLYPDVAAGRVAPATRPSSSRIVDPAHE